MLDFFGRDRWSRTTDDGVKVRCLTAWLYPYIKLKMGRVVGFEPTHNGATIRRVNRFTIPATCRPCRTTSIITYIYFIRQLVGLKKSFRFFCSFLKFYAFLRIFYTCFLRIFLHALLDIFLHIYVLYPILNTNEKID